MNTATFKILEEIIGIPFFDKTFETGAVCFATSDEVRADYKLQFTTDDVVDYIYGIVYQWYGNESELLTSYKIPYPTSATFFWKYCAAGKEYRAANSIKAIEIEALSDLNWHTISKN